MLRVVPVELEEANALVARWHRHHVPVLNHRFSLGVIDSDGVVHGAAICGRPVARLVPKRRVLEVNRLVTDGTYNACSILYGAAARAARAIGYERIQTYLLDTETGVSLRAAGWAFDRTTAGGQWVHTDGRPRRTDQPTTPKGRWFKALGPPFPAPVFPSDPDPAEGRLFDPEEL